MIVFWECELERTLIAGRRTNKSVLKPRYHATGTKLQSSICACAAIKGLTVFKPFEINGQGVTLFRNTINVDQLSLLLLEHFDDIVNVAFTDVTGKLCDPKIFDFI